MGMLNGSMRAVLCVRVPGIFIPSHCGTQAGRGLGRGWRNNLVSKLNRHVREQAMKHLLITTIAAVLLYLEWHGQGADMRAIPNNQFYINERVLQ
jgi:hypothetical protein